MKNVYVILAFHAHELLWDLPEKLLSYLEPDNPMKDSLQETNYLKKRKEEGRDIYSLCTQFGDRLDAPLCVEYTNELLVQLKQVIPESFDRLKEAYRRGRLYPLYGHAHHTHVSLLRPEEITQEILWNKEYLHNLMEVPYPKYNGLFPTEDSLTGSKLEGIAAGNVDYLIFPHLDKYKTHFILKGGGDYLYRPFLLKAKNKYLLALPRNFPISQEIWRPITKMRRDDLISQGYLLGDFPVFDNEYLTGEEEKYPISREEGVELYKKVLRQELERAPENGLLVYIQDLELMDFGDTALEIMEAAWKGLLQEAGDEYQVRFVTPDQYIDQVLVREGIEHLPVLYFDEMNWTPEIRLVLRPDGHYPPLGVTGVGPYDIHQTGEYEHPHIFWENGKYFCRIFDTLLENFGVYTAVPVEVGKLGDSGYDIAALSLEAQAVLYLRLIKRACNWGWVPTEGRQKRPCLKGYLLCSVLLKLLEKNTFPLQFRHGFQRIDPRYFVGLCATLRVFIDNRTAYLKYGLEEWEREKGAVVLPDIQPIFREVARWKEVALERAADMYRINSRLPQELSQFLRLFQEYCQAVYLATDHIQRIWGKSPDANYLVVKMYHYLYKLYPPLFPGMVEEIDAMDEQQVKAYFRREQETAETPTQLYR